MNRFTTRRTFRSPGKKRTAAVPFESLPPYVQMSVLIDRVYEDLDDDLRIQHVLEHMHKHAFFEERPSLFASVTNEKQIGAFQLDMRHRGGWTFYPVSIQRMKSAGTSPDTIEKVTECVKAGMKCVVFHAEDISKGKVMCF